MSEKKSRHAFGSKVDVQNAIDRNLIDAYDVLFLDGDSESPSIGWIDKDGNPVYVGMEASELQEQVEEIESKMTANSHEISTKIDQAVVDANSYTDEQIREAFSIIEF